MDAPIIRVLSTSKNAAAVRSNGTIVPVVSRTSSCGLRLASAAAAEASPAISAVLVADDPPAAALTPVTSSVGSPPSGSGTAVVGPGLGGTTTHRLRSAGVRAYPSSLLGHCRPGPRSTGYLSRWAAAARAAAGTGSAATAIADQVVAGLV